MLPGDKQDVACRNRIPVKEYDVLGIRPHNVRRGQAHDYPAEGA